MKISASFLSSNYNLEDTIKYLDNSSIDFIHVDFMDNTFVPYESLSLKDLEVLKKSKKDLDVHLMVNNPLKYLSFFSKLNTKYLTFHYEAVNNHLEIIDKIKKANIKVGIAINPETAVNVLNPYLDLIDLVLIMSVEPGRSGQQFISNIPTKIDELRKLDKKILISVDGGINKDTIKLVNTDIVVVGSYICKSNNFEERINSLRS